MAKITITIETDNDAFHPDPLLEVSRMLDKLSSELPSYGKPIKLDGKTLRDYNGNTCGVVKVQE